MVTTKRFASGSSIAAFGPKLPSTIFARAAAQLRQTGHSSTLQHFGRAKVGRAGLCCRSPQVLGFPRDMLAICRKGRERSFSAPGTTLSDALKGKTCKASGRRNADRSP